jgi:hypothetical protein
MPQPTQWVRLRETGDEFIINVADFEDAKHVAIDGPTASARAATPTSTFSASSVSTLTVPEGAATVTSAQAPTDADDDSQALLQNGPTLEEYLAAGYSAESYPPQGYAARESEAYTEYVRLRAANAGDDDTAAKTALWGSTVPEITARLQTMDDRQAIQLLRDREGENPRGPRVGVIRAVDDRLEEL